MRQEDDDDEADDVGEQTQYKQQVKDGLIHEQRALDNDNGETVINCFAAWKCNM